MTAYDMVISDGSSYVCSSDRKAGSWSDEEARQARPDVAYHRVALDRSIDREPAAVGAFWCDLMVEFADGRLTPLPVTPFPLAEAEAAYRFMQQARHIGRIALTRRFLRPEARSEEHTSELQSLMRLSYAVFCLQKKKNTNTHNTCSLTLH